jgi:hypothetical protein
MFIRNDKGDGEVYTISAHDDLQRTDGLSAVFVCALSVYAEVGSWMGKTLY